MPRKTAQFNCAVTNMLEIRLRSVGPQISAPHQLSRASTRLMLSLAQPLAAAHGPWGSSFHRSRRSYQQPVAPGSDAGLWGPADLGYPLKWPILPTENIANTRQTTNRPSSSLVTAAIAYSSDGLSQQLLKRPPNRYQPVSTNTARLFS